ncbi:hypothetical protein PIB30_072082 [Stylosanthes scabra]|uniref:Uncharacterized protein n=1 Tax=Stylosanthes scabra TaxID=79078 RepID=A0ABU6ZMT0_9FABA|nr:hypothetical protein [Stylosanthes scabra]
MEVIQSWSKSKDRGLLLKEEKGTSNHLSSAHCCNQDLDQERRLKVLLRERKSCELPSLALMGQLPFCIKLKLRILVDQASSFIGGNILVLKGGSAKSISTCFYEVKGLCEAFEKAKREKARVIGLVKSHEHLSRNLECVFLFCGLNLRVPLCQVGLALIPLPKLG